MKTKIERSDGSFQGQNVYRQWCLSLAQDVVSFSAQRNLQATDAGKRKGIQKKPPAGGLAVLGMQNLERTD